MRSAFCGVDNRGLFKLGAQAAFDPAFLIQDCASKSHTPGINGENDALFPSRKATTSEESIFGKARLNMDSDNPQSCGPQILNTYAAQSKAPCCPYRRSPPTANAVTVIDEMIVLVRLSYVT